MTFIRSFLFIALATGMAMHQQACAQQDTLNHIVRGVLITGNKITKEHIVLRELVIHEGDTLSNANLRALIEKCQNNLINTRLFHSVQVVPAFISRDEVIIRVELEERWYTWPIPIFEIAETNFNTWWLTKDFSRTNYGFYIAKQNFRGRRETLYLKLRFGYSKHYALRYQAPSVNKAQNLGFGLSVNYFQNREITVGTEGNKRIFYSPEDKGNSREEFVAETNLTFRRGIYNSHTGRIKYTKALVDDTVTTNYPGYFFLNRNYSEFITLSYTFKHDKRDVQAYPLHGHLLEATAIKNGLGFVQNNDLDLLITYFKFKKYWQLGARTFMASSVRLKATVNDPPYYNQEGMGYTDFVRGYEFYVIDGQHYGLFRSNFKYQLVKPTKINMGKMRNNFFSTFQFAFYLNAFFDIGYVVDDLYEDVNPLSNGNMNGYGIGLDFVTIYDYIVRMEVTRNALGETGFFLHFRQPI